MLTFLAFATCLFLHNTPDSVASPVDSLSVPYGRPILLDGRVGDAEWGDARTVGLAQGVRLLLKQDSVYLYVAVIVPSPRVFGVNLYLAPADDARSYLNLHASAKLGERTGRENAWPEWQWWNNARWSANVARFNAFEGTQRFLPDAAKEFQIARERLPGRMFELSLDLETPAGTETPVTTGVRRDGRAWHVVRVE